MASKSYNSVAQLRADTWCRLEDAAAQLARLAAADRPTDGHQAVCSELLALLSPVESYWAFPSGWQVAKLNRMFAAGEFDKFAQAVTVINHALTHDTYRWADADAAAVDEDDSSADLHWTDVHPTGKRDPLYFEVLVVATMTEAQERNLRKEARGWRRPDDEFVYEIVVVPNAVEALIAARLNMNLQAVVLGRRFATQTARDLSPLADFVDPTIADKLGDD